ncbi:MAG: hypothetical protein AAF228_13965 [Pseudomonadota bacterium]
MPQSVGRNASNEPEGTISYDLVIHGPNNSKTKLKSFLLPENDQGQIYINPRGYLVYRRTIDGAEGPLLRTSFMFLSNDGKLVIYDPKTDLPKELG